MPAPQSPWMDLNHPMAQKLASIGKHALESGQVDPEQAKAMAKAMGVLPREGTDDQNPLAMVASQPSSPLDIGGATGGGLYQASGMGAVPDRIGARADTMQKDTSNYKRSTNRLINRSPEDIRAARLQAQGVYPEVTGYEQAVNDQGEPVFNSQGQPVDDRDRPKYNFQNTQLDEQDPVHQQQVGLDKMQDLLGQEAKANLGRNTMDFSPLAALADSENARHGTATQLAASAVKPEDTTGKFMAYADEIQKRRADIQKAIAEGVKAQKGGSALDLLALSQLNQNSAGQHNANRDWAQQQDMLNTRQLDQRAFRSSQATIKRVASDPILRNQLQSFNAMGQALTFFQHADHVNAQMVDEVQQAIRQGLQASRGTNGGVGEREKAYLDSAGLSENRVMGWLSGNPQDIAKNDAIVQHLKNLAAIEQQNVQTLFDRHLKAAVSGDSWVYSHPRYQVDPATGEAPSGMDLKGSLMDMLSAQKGQISQPGATPLKGGARVTHKVTTAPRKDEKKPSGGLPSLDELDAELSRRGAK